MDGMAGQSRSLWSGHLRHPPCSLPPGLRALGNFGGSRRAPSDEGSIPSVQDPRDNHGNDSLRCVPGLSVPLRKKKNELVKMNHIKHMLSSTGNIHTSRYSKVVPHITTDTCVVWFYSFAGSWWSEGSSRKGRVYGRRWSDKGVSGRTRLVGETPRCRTPDVTGLRARTTDTHPRAVGHKCDIGPVPVNLRRVKDR